MNSIKKFAHRVWTMFVIIFTGSTVFPDLLHKKKTNGEKLWRDNRASQKEPTAHEVVNCAGDAIFERHFLRIVIRHVQTMQGRGFMASVQDIRGAGSVDGTVFLIEDGDAYTQAVIEGHTLLVKKLDERMFHNMRSRMEISSRNARIDLN